MKWILTERLAEAIQQEHLSDSKSTMLSDFRHSLNFLLDSGSLAEPLDAIGGTLRFHGTLFEKLWSDGLGIPLLVSSLIHSFIFVQK